MTRTEGIFQHEPKPESAVWCPPIPGSIGEAEMDEDEDELQDDADSGHGR